MTDLLSEITLCDECSYSGEPNGCNRKEGICKAYESYFDLVEENAALRERLSHSLELPYMEQTISCNGTEDTILYYLENGKLQQECFNNKFPEQLQARLAELKGE